MGQFPESEKPRVSSALLLGLLLFVVYNSNFRLIRSGDTIPARLLPFSLLLERHVYLDGWIVPYLYDPGQNGVNAVRVSHGHWVSAYPIVMPLAITPLYLLPAWWVSRQQPRPAPADVVMQAMTDVMEKFSATILASLSAGLLYLALGRIVSAGTGFLLALIYGLASNTWTISSQALWRQGFSELGFVLLLWALLARPDSAWGTFLAGSALGLAAANKPGHALVAIAFLVYVLGRQRSRLLLFVGPLLVIGALVVAYNYSFFSHLLGATADPYARPASSVGLDLSHSTVSNGLAGLLVSPSRGLLIFMPWTLFAVWGASKLWERPQFGWDRYLIAGALAVFLGHAFFWGWSGGHGYGPRYLTDLLPFLVFFLVPVWPRLSGSTVLRVGFGLAVAAALWVQIVGAYFYPNGHWDWRPVNVNQASGRLWDWRDTPISRSWKAGPSYPWLWDEFYLVASQVWTSGRRGVLPPPGRHAAQSPRDPSLRREGAR